MHLFCSVGKYFESDVNAYSSFFQKILEVGAKIYTTSMVISEFFNAYCKVEYHLAKGERSTVEFDYKKDFRKSREFDELIGLLKNIVKKKILKNTTKLNDSFEKINIDAIFDEKKDFDFNDQYFIELCKEHSIMIVTHDKDFLDTEHDIVILTNRKIPVCSK
jgi:predicted nucleic acid-binding protein